MVALVLLLMPKAFLHECTSLFPGLHYFRKLLPQFAVHHFQVDPQDHGCPCRRKRVYDCCLRRDMMLEGDASEFRRMHARSELDGTVFLRAREHEALWDVRYLGRCCVQRLAANLHRPGCGTSRSYGEDSDAGQGQRLLGFAPSFGQGCLFSRRCEVIGLRVHGKLDFSRARGSFADIAVPSGRPSASG